MLDALVDNRLALDETSLDFRNLDTPDLQQHLDHLNDTHAAVRGDGFAVRVHPWLWDTLECMDGVPLCDFVYQSGTSAVSRDTLRRLGVLLDKCPSWSEGDQSFVDSLGAVEIESTGAGSAADTVRVRVDPAYSLGLILSCQQRMALLTFAAAGRRGPWTVSAEGKSASVFFFTSATELCAFWRSLFSEEKIKEIEFFTLARYAYPNLVFHPKLNFGGFDGSYRDVRDAVANILGALNDHFAAAFNAHNGLPYDIQAALEAHGVDLSPESPKTGGSAKLMAQRTVVLDGDSYVCEWHAKVEPHQNRIHFSLPDAKLDGRVLVGLFVKHLDT